MTSTNRRNTGFGLPVTASARELISAVRSARRAPGVAAVLLPGERAFRARCRAVEESIDIDEDVHRLLPAAGA